MKRKALQNEMHKGLHLGRTSHRAFARAGTLQTHVNTVHLKKKPYKCSHCDSAFGYAHHLERHVNTVHLKKKPHECPHCDSAFGAAHHLETHMNTVHLGKRLHKCKHCDMDQLSTSMDN